MKINIFPICVITCLSPLPSLLPYEPEKSLFSLAAGRNSVSPPQRGRVGCEQSAVVKHSCRREELAFGVNMSKCNLFGFVITHFL